MTRPNRKQMSAPHPGFGIYMVTYIGALIYFLDKAEGFGESLLGFLQAAVWPAYIVNHILTILRV
jgi:hypothetical protein